MIKKGIDDSLLLAHKFLALLEAVRLALDVNDSAVMQDAVENGGGDCNVGKNLVPLGEGFVGGKDGGGFLITSGDELEEQIGTLDIHREITDFINDEHPVLGENLQLVGETVFKVGLFKLLNELMAVDVVGREPVLGSHQAECGSQVGFAYTRWAEKYHVFSVLQKAHGSEFIDLALVDGGLKGKVKVVQGFLDGEAGHLYLLFVGTFAFGFGLFGKDMIKNLHNVEFVSNSPFQVVAPKGRLRTPGFPACSSS